MLNADISFASFSDDDKRNRKVKAKMEKPEVLEKG